LLSDLDSDLLSLAELDIVPGPDGLAEAEALLDSEAEGERDLDSLPDGEALKLPDSD